MQMHGLPQPGIARPGSSQVNHLEDPHFIILQELDEGYGSKGAVRLEQYLTVSRNHSGPDQPAGRIKPPIAGL